jgi:hypothetical protein
MVYGACGRSGACEYAFRIVGEEATPSGRGVLHSGARGTRCACARHTPRGEVSQPEGCMRRRALRVTPVYFASARVARCLGACCRLNRLVLHRLVLHVANAQASRSAFAVLSAVDALRVRCSIGRRAGCCGRRAAARGACVQHYGGVLSMASGSGTALFDAVETSGTEAAVRAGLMWRCAVGAGVGGRGARADCNGRGCAGWCAGRRRGAHARWGRHVQGRLDLEQQGGGACAWRESRVPRAVVWYVARCSMAGGWRARCGARMLRRMVYGVRRMRLAWRVLCVLHHHVASIHVASLHRRALHRCALYVASVCVACCVGLCCMLQPRSRPAAHGRAVRCVVSAARVLPDVHAVQDVPVRYAMCMLHRRALRVASVGARCTLQVASARCIGSRCLGPCCIGAAQPSRSAVAV